MTGGDLSGLEEIGKDYESIAIAPVFELCNFGRLWFIAPQQEDSRKPAQTMSAKKEKVSKKKEIFQLNAPEAESVMLAGDFTDWENAARKMRKLKSGNWKTTVSLEEDKTIQYRFLVDGQWVDDPDCQNRIPNGFGGENCVRQVGEE